MATMTKDSNALTIGLAEINVNNEDVGSVSDGTLELTQEIAEHKSGLPLTIDKRVIIERGAKFTATWEEIHAENMAAAIGMATTSAGYTDFTYGGNYTDYKAIYLGRDEPVLEVPVTIKHTRPDGLDVYIKFFKASPGGTFTMPFNPTDWVGMSVEFGSVVDTTHPEAPLGYIVVPVNQA